MVLMSASSAIQLVRPGALLMATRTAELPPHVQLTTQPTELNAGSSARGPPTGDRLIILVSHAMRLARPALAVLLISARFAIQQTDSP